MTHTGLAVVFMTAAFMAGSARPSLAAQGPVPAATSVDAAPSRIDYLTFAQGAVPITIGGTGAALGADFEAAIRSVDGDTVPFTVVNGAPAGTATEFIYELPAATTFDRFAVPNVLETPSPTATFTQRVEVYGSRTSATAGYTLIAAATMQTHRSRGLVTELEIIDRSSVVWIKLRLVGGINVMRPASSFEFSELIGNGNQETAHFSTRFNGTWRTQANRVRLIQKGSVVSGCYDAAGDLTGTVSGNILRATGLDRQNKTPSAFVLSVAADGGLRGVRSSNGAPFRLYTVAPARTGVDCGNPPPPSLGCGSIIHSITFAYDSAEIRPESMAVLGELFAGLRGLPSAAIVIEGHTSNEGTEDYNDRLSARRAQAVVADLVRRGLPRERLTAAGIGERRPIAGNNDENGRSLNRRVEVQCK